VKSVDDFMFNWFKHPSRFYPTGDFNRVIFYIQNLEKKSIEIVVIIKALQQSVLDSYNTFLYFIVT
jgi:hypothetical protein